MNGLLWYLVFGALFYFMMRYGCGAHMVHGHGEHNSHGGHGEERGKLEHAKGSLDPVCGMQVPPDKGYSKMHNGEQYRFCSRDCLDQFEAAPDRYLNAQDSGAGGNV